MKINFQVDRSKLITQYRFALEQALAKAEFITSPELVVLQAFILFLVLVRRHDDTRFSWTLTGLAIRMGQSMGLHRDGASFPGLTPLEIEMRRRLFWALCILDMRSAEDQGTDLSIVDRTFDTELPLNINDTDLTDDMTALPPARQGATDMTFSLIRYEICSLARRLYQVSSNTTGGCPRETPTSLEEREGMVRSIYETVEEKYFKDASASCNAMLWTAANIARVIVAKMTLVIYQPMLFPGPDGEVLSDEIRERIFTAATEIFEYNHQLNSDPRSKQWQWLFQTYTQWHAVAYVLMEVVRREWSAGVERAWTALNSIFANPSPQDLDRIVGDQSMWLPLKKVYLKAKRYRESEIARLKADPEAAQQLQVHERSKAPVPLSFAAMPGSVKSAIATERWRKLVNAPPLPPELQKPPPHQPFAAAPKPPQDAAGGRPEERLPNNMDTSGGGATDPALQDARAMNLVGNVMSTPHFLPDTLFPIAFAPEYQDLARGGFPYLGGGGGDIPRQDVTLANMVNNNNNNNNNNNINNSSNNNNNNNNTNNNSQGGAVPNAAATSAMDPRLQATPLLDALKIEGHIPPWMWQDSSASIFNSSPGATGSTPGGPTGGAAHGMPMSATTRPASFGFPLAGGPGGEGIQPEDIDMDMNEDFNWADWGQSLMESGGNMGGVWSAHGI